jgi:hypothetical protein
MRPQTPLEVCTQIVSDHAADTISAIAARRTARLAARLEDYATGLIELADGNGKPKLPSEHEPGRHGTGRA